MQVGRMIKPAEMKETLSMILHHAVVYDFVRLSFVGRVH